MNKINKCIKIISLEIFILIMDDICYIHNTLYRLNENYKNQKINICEEINNLKKQKRKLELLINYEIDKNTIYYKRQKYNYYCICILLDDLKWYIKNL